MNLLHDIPAGSKDEMNVIIEIPRGARNKYEIDKKTGVITLDRVLHTAQVYPVEYGFVPQTLWDDGDALDVILLSTEPFLPGVIIPARPIAVLPMVDGGEKDEKVLAVAVSDPRFKDVMDLKDVNAHTLKEISHFFQTYKQLQNKEVQLGEWEGKEAAQAAFERAVKIYSEKMAK